MSLDQLDRFRRDPLEYCRDHFSGNKLCNLRMRAGMTQSQLAVLAGTTQKSISDWECGKYAPSKLLIFRLTVALNVTSRDLCSRVPSVA